MQWKPAELERLLGKQQPGLVVIYGDDGGQVMQLIQSALNILVPDRNDPFSFDPIDFSTLMDDPGAVYAALTTLGFGASHKVVHLKGIHQKPAEKEMAVLQKALEEILEETPAHATLVVGIPGLDKKLALARKIEKHPKAVGIQCYLDKERDLAGFAQHYVQQAGYHLQADAAVLLSEVLGKDREITRQELDKLMIYVGESGAIGREDCQQSIAGGRALNIFTLCDAVGSGQGQRVHTLLVEMMEDKVKEDYILTMISRHIRRLWQCAVLAEQSGQPASQAAKQLRPPVAPFAMTQFSGQVRRHNSGVWAQKSQLCFKALEQLRHHQADARRTLERLCMALAR